TAWKLNITDARSIKAFINEIGILGKDEILANILELLKNRHYQTTKDLIPMPIPDFLSIATAGEESWRSPGRRAGIRGHADLHAGHRVTTRERLKILDSGLNDKYLQKIAESEVYWDEIVSIEFAGNKQVYDLTIPET